MSYNTGPATIKIGSGPRLYSAEGVNLKLATRTRDLVSDMHGSLGKILQSRSVVLTLKEIGRISSAFLSSLLPSGLAIGASIFTAADVPIEVWTLAGQKITWTCGAVTKFPVLTFSANKEIYAGGDLEITCLGARTTSGATSPTSAGHWNTIASTAFADTTFDETLIKRYLYTAAYGESPFDAMTAQDGFTVEIDQQTEELMDDNIGLADIFLKGITASARFIPSNLAEGDLWTLLQLQGASALRPGMLINGGGANDFVITGDDGDTNFSLTLNKPGFHDGATLYTTGKLRAGEIMCTASRTFTTGVSDALFTFAEGSDS